VTPDTRRLSGRDAYESCSSLVCARASANFNSAVVDSPFEEVVVDDKQLAKLIRKNVAKVEKAATAKQKRTYDPTLAATRGTTADDSDTEVERTQFFKEMKRREF
jgi:hypothetical protein